MASMMTEALWWSILICIILGFTDCKQGNAFSETCGTRNLTCPCLYNGSGSISVNIILCRTSSNQCEACDRINDTIKCRVYQFYCTKPRNNATKSTIITSTITPTCLCQNGGICQAYKDALCDCPFGFSGQFCQFATTSTQTQTPANLVTPEQITCQIPSSPANGMIVLESNTIRPGEYIQYKCVEGFTLYGNITRYCLPNGMFAGDEPICEKTCTIPDMKYYKLSYVINPNHNNQQQLIDRFGDALITEIEFSCLEDFYLQGPARIRCINGVWDNNPPQCGVGCTLPKVQPPLIQTPQTTNNSAVIPGVILTYSCANGEKLIGDSVIVCTYSGTWEPQIPTCFDERVPVASSAPTNEKQCSFPKNPEHGDISISVSPSDLHKYNNFTTVPIKTKITYTCNEFYELTSSSPIRECLSDGSWSGKQPYCVPQCGKTYDPKIVKVINGMNWSIIQWPWQAGFYDISSGSFHCGGTVVTETWVLTAAHCFVDQFPDGKSARVNKERLGLFFGQDIPKLDSTNPDMVTRKIIDAFVHPNFDPVTKDSDIALIRLDTPLTFNNKIRPVCLPNSQQFVTDIPSIGMVAGWGRTNPNVNEEAKTLQIITVRIVSNEECRSHLLDLSGFSYTITENMFCADSKAGSGTCYGDSGGSLCVTGSGENPAYQIEGIVSWGSHNVCATPGYYEGFTRVRQFIDWIHEYVNI